MHNGQLHSFVHFKKCYKGDQINIERRAGYVTPTEEMRNRYKIERNRLLARSRSLWDDNIKTDLKQTVYKVGGEVLCAR